MQTAWKAGVALGLVTSLVGLAAHAVPVTDGTIRLDGSSTVYPIAEAVAEEFGKENRGVKVTVGISGTGGGFKRFCTGETDISDASRPIKPTEVELCKQNGIEYVELPVAYDALTVVVNPKNTWLNSITVSDLRKIWEPAAQGKVMTWNQVRPEWPNQPIRLFGAGTDSGTYDYFTEAIMGKEDMSRGDYTSSEDDNVVVQGVSSDPNALGFFGVAYYTENSSRVKALAIDDENDANGKGPQLPNLENVINGSYKPLARPLFIYVSKKSAERPEVAQFIQFFMKNGGALSQEVGYIPLQESVANLALARFDARTPGSVFENVSQVGATLEDLLKKS